MSDQQPAEIPRDAAAIAAGGVPVVLDLRETEKQIEEYRGLASSIRGIGWVAALRFRDVDA